MLDDRSYPPQRAVLARRPVTVMTTHVLFIQGGGDGAYDEDAALVGSLRRGLGEEYRVHAPRMPDEAEPRSGPWKKAIADALADLTERIVIVGHSLGGSILLQYLAEKRGAPSIDGVFLLAAPSRDEADWDFEDLGLPDDLGARLGSVPRIFLYHARDDGIVPFRHLALHAARLPRAIVRAIDDGGHQFGNDLGMVARDIRSPAA